MGGDTTVTSIFRVDTDRIATASADIRRISGSIDSEVRAMMARLTDLQGSWQGSAATNFAALSDEWRRTQEQVRTSLDNISEALSVAGQQYASAEQANSTMFRV